MGENEMRGGRESIYLAEIVLVTCDIVVLDEGSRTLPILREVSDLQTAEIDVGHGVEEQEDKDTCRMYAVDITLISWC